MNKNEALGVIYDNLKENHGFGSLFQFWKGQVLGELLEEFKVEYGESSKIIEVDYNTLDDISINIIKRISQEI